MARDNRGPANGVNASLQRQIDVLSDRLRDLERRRVLTSGIPGDLDLILDPVEGEHVIDNSDDRHAWYSNGAWHKAAQIAPHGIIRGTSLSPGGAGFSYMDWDTASGALIADEGGNGSTTTESESSYDDGIYAIDHATYPEVFCFVKQPGIYIVCIHVTFFDSTPSFPSTWNNSLEWSPGGYVAGGGGAGYAEYEEVFVDNALEGAAVQYMSRMTLAFCPPSIVSGDGAPMNRFRAYSTHSYETLSVAGSVWRVGHWST